MSLGNKLVLFLTLPLIAIMTLFAVLTHVRSNDLLHREMVREGRAVMRVAQEAMEDYLRDRQIDDLRDLGEQLTGFERVIGVQIYDVQGHVVFRSKTLDQTPEAPAADIEAALKEARPSETQRRLHGTRVISFVRPLFAPDGATVGAMQILHAESFIDEAARASRDWIVSLTVAMIGVMALVVFLVARAGIGRPAAELVERFRAVGSGDLSARPPVGRRDEFGALAREFENMVRQLEEARRSLVAEQEERRRVESRLRHAERLASVGRLAAGLAHEIGTPLNVIGGRAEALQRRFAEQEEARRGLGIISGQIDRISRIVRSLLDFARGSAPRLAWVEIDDVVRKVADLLEQRLDGAGVRLVLDLPADLPKVRADADQMQQVFLNLAANAIDAMPAGGTLEIRAERRSTVPMGLPLGDGDPPLDGEDSGPAGFLAISCLDTGSGIPAEHLGRVFDPFFTTKDVGKGTGLGLSVSYGIVRDHGGGIDVESTPGSGSRFTVYLPLTGAAGRAAEDQVAGTDSREAGARVAEGRA